jgi:hypothetical protein
MRAGHKGLFCERLDLGVGLTGELTPRLVPDAMNLYHDRNRMYNPQVGRFLQPDPNATAMAIATSPAFNGRGAESLSAAFDLEAHMGDGLNVYEYLGSNPWRRSDAMGLSWDPFDMVDDYLATDAASKAAFLSRVIGGAKTVAYVAAYVGQFFPGPVGFLSQGVLEALGESPDELNGTLVGDAIKITNESMQALALLGEIQTISLEMSVHYAEKFSGFSVSGASPSSLTTQGTQIASAGGLEALFGAAALSVAVERNTHVYVGKNAAGEVVYVGTSNNVARRRIEHGDRFPGGVHRVTKQPMHILQAKAIETEVIETARRTGRLKLENKIRSISPLRTIFGIASSWARDWLIHNAADLAH